MIHCFWFSPTPTPPMKCTYVFTTCGCIYIHIAASVWFSPTTDCHLCHSIWMYLHTQLLQRHVACFRHIPDISPCCITHGWHVIPRCFKNMSSQTCHDAQYALLVVHTPLIANFKTQGISRNGKCSLRAGITSLLIVKTYNAWRCVTSEPSKTMVHALIRQIIVTLSFIVYGLPKINFIHYCWYLIQQIMETIIRLPMSSLNFIGSLLSRELYTISCS